jgi:hypothetical protein
MFGQYLRDFFDDFLRCFFIHDLVILIFKTIYAMKIALICQGERER